MKRMCQQLSLAYFLLVITCCSDWNEDGPHRLIGFSARSTVGELFWEKSGGMALLKWLCDLKWF